MKPADIPEAIGTELGKTPWSDSFFRSQVRGAIRRIYFMWPGKKAVIDRTRLEVMVRKADGKGYKKVVWHKCETCERLCKSQLTPKHKALLKPWKKACTAAKKAELPTPERPDVPHQIWCDHIDPVVSVSGEMPDWHTYIMRTFVDPTKMQAICDVCHSAKTKAENAERRANVKLRTVG